MSLHPGKLPPDADLETRPILKTLARAHRALAELKGVSGQIPNQAILINTLALQEARDSSAIENIITTQDELFRHQAFPEYTIHAAAKEVARYASALRIGYQLVRDQGILTSNHLLAIQEELEGNNAGFRRLPGTALINDQTGQVIYTPPQEHAIIVELMADLERYINDDALSDVDPLIKMAVIHHQFESIHPFYDGNGRTGRILNVLYLVLKGLLDIPVLYLSRYIIRRKADYYRLLQEVRVTGAWEAWVIYMLSAVEQTSLEAVTLIHQIKAALLDYKHRIRAEYRFYSQDLINNLFFHPYTKIEFVQRELNVSRLTATRYLDALTEGGFLNKHRSSRSNYYVNRALHEILFTEEESSAV